MKNFLVRTAVFLRLVDAYDGNISLTNVALFIILYKLMTTPATSIMDLGSLVIALGNYSYKKYLNKNSIVGNMVHQIEKEADSDEKQA